ncbi:MAG: hypothetical protein Q9186_004645 [Xanthomendoza sp. 1 TL-2023]
MRTNRFIYGEVSYEIYRDRTLRFEIHPLDDRWVPMDIKTKPRHLRHTHISKFKKLRIDVFAPDLRDRGQVHQLRDSAIDLVCVLCGHQSRLESGMPAYSTFDQQLLLHHTVDNLSRWESGQQSLTPVGRVNNAWVIDPSGYHAWHPIRRPPSQSNVLTIDNMGLPEDRMASLPPGDWIFGGLPPIELVLHDTVRTRWGRNIIAQEQLLQLCERARDFRSTSTALYPFLLLKAFCGVKMTVSVLDQQGEVVSASDTAMEILLQCGPPTWDGWGEWIWKQHEVSMELEGTLDTLEGATADRLRSLRFQHWRKYESSLNYLFIHLNLENREKLLFLHGERLNGYREFEVLRQAQDEQRRSMEELHKHRLDELAKNSSSQMNLPA